MESALADGTVKNNPAAALKHFKALANDAAILLADEPTASLQREAADQLIEDMTSLARDNGRSMIAVSHDTNLLERMDRVLTVRDGRIVGEAST